MFSIEANAFVRPLSGPRDGGSSKTNSTSDGNQEGAFRAETNTFLQSQFSQDLQLSLPERTAVENDCRLVPPHPSRFASGKQNPAERHSGMLPFHRNVLKCLSSAMSLDTDTVTRWNLSDFGNRFGLVGPASARPLRTKAGLRFVRHGTDSLWRDCRRAGSPRATPHPKAPSSLRLPRTPKMALFGAVQRSRDIALSCRADCVKLGAFVRLSLFQATTLL